VWDSEARDEYQETQHKARVLTQPAVEFSLIESLRWVPGEGYWLLDYHLRRLRDSADYFDFAWDEARTRITLERGAGTLSLVPHKARLLLARDGALSFSAVPVETHLEPVSLVLAKRNVHSGDKFLFHKTTRRGVYEAALAERDGGEDVLLWNERGELTETCTANIVVQFGSEYWTPPVECGLLAGAYRAALLDEGMLSERVIPWQELRDATALFRINSVRGWQRAELISPF
jgi:para-aminobenzoate synthetase/4-amino-4-deoxychorismate lyase